ncbi:unnamed protein product [Chrysodeixis includens]|uniref:Lipocalin/cytosolic fatty-acid binding domain-containing protein n=1 Tax=Chrysodeixis includens TaxID=689277 RepID=A0A9P0FV51_CHRIL|nr:unnamed protein product [Chrysodeixis includens]
MQSLWNFRIVSKPSDFHVLMENFVTRYLLNNSHLILNKHFISDKVLQFPFFILSTDYDGYAIAYTCKWLKQKERKHYVHAWVLTRSKERLEGELLKKVEGTIAKYTDLAEHRQSFVFKDFSDASCSYSNKLDTDFFTTVFW